MVRRIWLPTVRYTLLFLSIAFLAIVSAGSSGPVDATNTTSTPQVNAASTSTGVLQGDIDCSGATDINDAMQLLRWQGSITSNTACIQSAGNVDCTDWITTMDALWIVSHAAGLSPATPATCTAIGAEITGGPSSVDLIEAALTAGTLNAETALKYEVFASFSDTRLPTEYRGYDSGGEPMDVLDRAAQGYRGFSPQTQADLDPFFKRPDEPGSWMTLDTVGPAATDARPAAAADITWNTYAAAGGKVKLWAQNRYPGDAAKAEAIAGAMTSKIWPTFLALMGRAPIEDAGLANNGGDGAIDIYLVDAPLVQSVDSEGNITSAKPWAGIAQAADKNNPCQLSPRYLLLDNRAPLGSETSSGMLQTATHELFHAFQYAFPLADACWTPEYAWFFEASATWSEQFVYPKANSERAFSLAFFEGPENPPISLEYYAYLDDHAYGAYLFPYFLEKTTQPQIIRSIFLAFGSKLSLDAINSAVPGGLAKTFPKFVSYLWNREPVDYFEKWDDIRYQWYAKSDLERPMPVGTTYELPVIEPEMHGAFYSFKFPDDVMQVVFTNTIVSEALTDGSVYAIAKINGEWKDPILLDQPEKKWCRDNPDEDVSELVLVVTNSDYSLKTTLHPIEAPRLKARAQGCEGWAGTMTGTETWNQPGDTHGTASRTFTGTWMANDLTPCTSTGCVSYDPHGTLSWSWDAHREAWGACDQTTSGSLPFATTSGELDYFVLEPVNDGLEYKYYGLGDIPSLATTLKCGTDRVVEPPPFFFIFASSDGDGTPHNGATCVFTTWRIPNDAETIDGSCYQFNNGYNSLQYEWHLTRVGNAIP